MNNMNEPKIRQCLNKYQNPEITGREIFNVIKNYKSLYGSCQNFVINDGSCQELFNLQGTIPVTCKGTVYNIPICIWVIYTHPNNAPMCYVRPTADMIIEVSKYVDHNGKIYLPYLRDWVPYSSNLLGLIQVMIVTFGEHPQIDAKRSTQSTPYPTQPCENAITVAAQRILDTCVDRLKEKEERLKKLIDSSLEDNNQVALSFIFDSLVNDMLKKMAEARAFIKPVDKKEVKEYYTVIKRPIDLEIISEKVSAHKYHSRHEFMRDVTQILENCAQFIGKNSPLTMNAETLVKVCKQRLDNYGEYIIHLEENISLVQQAMDQAEMDSFWSPPDETNYTILEPDNHTSQINSSDDLYGKPYVDEDDLEFVDVEGDLEMEINEQNEDLEDLF